VTTYGMESEPPRCPHCDATLGTWESNVAPACYSCGKPFSEEPMKEPSEKAVERAIRAYRSLDTYGSQIHGRGMQAALRAAYRVDFGEGPDHPCPPVPAEPALAAPDGLDTHTEDPF
jgi:hypothetical protein